MRLRIEFCFDSLNCRRFRRQRKITSVDFVDLVDLVDRGPEECER